MGKAGRWLKSILAGRKDKALHQPYQQQQGAGAGDATPLPASPREKKRWSFRRPAPAATPTQQGKKVSNAQAPSPLSLQEPSASARELDQSSDHAVAAGAADAAVMDAAEAAAAVAHLTASAEEESHHLAVSCCPVEEAAAARIQATFRGYLARKALCALRGLVKLQALVRGQLVRRQATATLRRMQALLDAQSRLRAQRARMLDVAPPPPAAYQARRSPQHPTIPRRRSSYEVMDRSAAGEEHVKIVEMDVGEPARRGRSSCSAAATESRDRLLAEYYNYNGGSGAEQCSPAPSSAAFFSAELSPPRSYSGHFEDAFDPAAATTRSSSPYMAPYDAAAAAGDGYGGVVPSYMANTESSRAKARSQSAPRQRTADAALERQPSSRRRGQLGQGGAPRKMMQRSSSHIGVPAAAAAASCGYGYGYAYGYGYGYQHAQPWAGVRLDRSSASVVGSECGSTSSVLTAATVGYCRSLVGFEVQRGHY